MSHIKAIAALLDKLLEEQNQVVDDYNALLDILDTRDTEISMLQLELAGIKEQLVTKDTLSSKQHTALVTAVDHKERDKSALRLLEAQLKELKSLDPKRLAKVNKTQKKTITTLKETNTRLVKDRKEAIADTNKMAKAVADSNILPFYTDAETGNSIRFVPYTFVGTDNLKGVSDSPLVEFTHSDRGISRQGILGRDGEVVWASAKNSIPTENDSLVAKAEIIKYCKNHKIKIG